MELAVGAYTVTIKDSLTWGDAQQIQSAMVAGAKIGAAGLTGYDASAMIEAKYKLLEIAVVSIKEGEKTVPFSREWMNALSIGDGDTLYTAVDKLSKKKIAIDSLQVEGKAPADPIVLMEALSAEYGWTPVEIRAQRVEDISAYLHIIRIKRLIQKHGNERT